MYKQVPTDQKFVEREREIETFWKEHDIFRKSESEREGCPTYMFYDGPPTANGKPHIGHVETRAIKDMIPRYKTMKGYQVPRKAGWDTHGLPVELEVEKSLGINGKEQIESYGMAEFIEKCKESVWRYKGMWEKFSGAVGFWADMDNPYVTYDNRYIESVWWALKEIFNKNLLYKGFKIVPYCPRCGTPLSSHEVAQGYQDVKERSAIAKFRVKGEENVYILAWTTTPWTLPSNVALCVSPTDTYVKVRMTDGTIYYLAKALTEKVLGNATTEEGTQYEILEEIVGENLVGMEYEPLFAYPNVDKKKTGFTIVSDSYVTMEDGTGIVHIAPAFGEDDYRIGVRYDLPFLQLVDLKGCLKEGTIAPGVFCKDADKLILEDLTKRGLLYAAPKFEHSYPFCWRCHTPLIYYARESWFIKMTAVKEDLIKNNDTINWIPESIGKGRFGDWLNNVQDWGVSRNRYWGTPLNIWTCECGELYSVGSIEELKKMSPDCPDTIELHRPYIDNVHLTCPKCGKTMTRVPEVIDCWFDAGSMPFAQFHYPFENQEYFEKHFPADFISEAVDQTRGWFYTLLAISTILFNKAPFKNVIVMGLVQDKDGQKLSKSKGNYVDPMELLEKYGADAIRWYFYSACAPHLPKRFNEEVVLEGRSKFMGTLWNTYAFYTLYADIDGFNPEKYKENGIWKPKNLSVMDRWVLSKLNTLIETCNDNLDSYKITETARALQDFMDDLSNWYVRRSRDRYWGKDMPEDKVNAYMTLYTAILTVSYLSAPMIPFMTEQIYQNIVRTVNPDAPESIHLCAYPKADTSLIDKDLEASMEEVLSIVVSARACRNKANIKNRQPLSKMFIKAPFSPDSECTEILLDELNVKTAEFTDNTDSFTGYSFKPQLKTVGPKYGKVLGAIQNYLREVDGKKGMAELNETGKLSFTVNDTAVELTKDDLLIALSEVPGYATEVAGDITVVLDTTLTEELIDEGFVREIISKVQTMRKEADFNVVDRIRLTYDAGDKLARIFEKYAKEIGKDTLSKEIAVGVKGYTKEWDINGETCTLGVEKL